MTNLSNVTNVIKWVGTAIEDENGGISSMRIIMLLWMLVMSFGVAWVVYNTKIFPDIPQSIVEITAGIVFGKVVQKNTEIKATLNGNGAPANTDNSQ